MGLTGLLAWGATNLPTAPEAVPPNFAHPLPPLMLWAWERPEDLSFLDPAEAGVAYLAGTATLRGGDVLWRPRFQPLAVPPGAAVVAVVRVESSPRRPPALTASQADRLLSLLLRAARKPGLAGLQVDFDAAASQREFYADFLARVRRALPKGQHLSVTALASWRLDERWSCALPVDEAVVMLFRMGPSAADVRRRLPGAAPACGGRPDSFGVSLDEPIPALPPGRVYGFNPRPWTPEDLAALRSLLARGGQPPRSSPDGPRVPCVPDPVPTEVSHALQR